jgi:hypothetical protein
MSLSGNKMRTMEDIAAAVCLVLKIEDIRSETSSHVTQAKRSFVCYEQARQELEANLDGMFADITAGMKAAEAHKCILEYTNALPKNQQRLLSEVYVALKAAETSAPAVAFSVEGFVNAMLVARSAMRSVGFDKE